MVVDNDDDDDDENEKTHSEKISRKFVLDVCNELDDVIALTFNYFQKDCAAIVGSVYSRIQFDLLYSTV